MPPSQRYFDYAATTPADHRVITAMMGCLGVDGHFGNPASLSHEAGHAARARVETARAQVAALIAAHTDEIVWTSGATESNNLALKGFADAAGERRHIVTSRLEHKAILDTAASLERRGVAVTYLSPDAHGAITPAALAAALRPDTGLVSLMLVNNELGTLTDIGAIAPLVRETGALLHVDAAQALGKIPIDVAALGIDLMSMSAHKAYGPKGVGALYVRRTVDAHLAPQMHGGGHERGLRSGTLATHQIAGMGMACAVAAAEQDAEYVRIAALNQRLLDGVRALDVVHLNGANVPRIPHTLSLTIARDGFFPFQLASALAVSSTSACSAAAGAASHVLGAIGLDAASAGRTVRLSLGRFTTDDDIDVAIAALRQCVTP